MSKLGNIQRSYGKQFTIAIANSYVDNVLNANMLPKNAIIISSPYDTTTYEDLGTPSIIATDNDGVGVLVTKSIAANNGLVYEDDSLSLKVDGTTLKEVDGKLDIDINGLVSTTNGLQAGTYLSIGNTAIQKASATKFGVAKVDGTTIKSDNGMLYVETSGLDHATRLAKGIVIGDGTTLSVINGNPQVATQNLTKAGTSFGVAKPDNISIVASNGELSINETYFISDTEVGILKTGQGIVSNNGVLSVDEASFPKASTTKAGVVKFNGEQFEASEDGKLSVKGYDEFMSQLSTLSTRIENATNEVDAIEQEIASL